MVEEHDTAGPVAVHAMTDDELRIAYGGPAYSANKLFVTLSPAGARIAFTEQYKNNPPQFRTAVVLPFGDAIALKDLLANLLKDVEEQIAAAKQKGG